MSTNSTEGAIPQHGYDAAKEFTNNMNEFGFNRGIGGQKSAFLAGYQSCYRKLTETKAPVLRKDVINVLDWILQNGLEPGSTKKWHDFRISPYARFTSEELVERYIEESTAPEA